MATFYKMALCPQQDGYNAVINYGKTRIQLDGGRSRFRRQYKGTSSTVNVSWLVEKEGYEYLVAFQSLYAKQDNPFLIDLIIDSADLMTYKADFVGEFKLSKAEGFSYQVSAELEVGALYRSNEYDEIIIGGVLGLINPLEKLVNVDLANALENVSE